MDGPEERAMHIPGKGKGLKYLELDLEVENRRVRLGIR